MPERLRIVFMGTPEVALVRIEMVAENGIENIAGRLKISEVLL